MHKAFLAAVSCLALGATGIATNASAQHRDHGQQDRFIESFCGRHHDGDCDDWRRDHNRWNDSHYQRWYRHHEHDFGDVAAAMIFGMAAQAIGSAITNSSHVQACKNRYRSYDRSSDTYLGYDGWRHYCRL